MEPAWLGRLKALVAKKPIVVLKFGEDDWYDLQNSRRGVSDFTIARRRSQIAHVGLGTVSLIEAAGQDGGLHVGLIRSRSAVSSLESRLAVSRVSLIRPSSLPDLRRLIAENRGLRSAAERLSAEKDETLLTPQLSVATIAALAGIQSNEVALRALADSPSLPVRIHGAAELQQDAVRTALQAFGLTIDAEARSVSLVRPQETALARVRVLEDRVIEHDARYVPGYDLVGSDLTGRALFRREGDELEVFTANRTPLEQAFGADLVYLNASKQNIVMVQYKMLDPEPPGGLEPDWVYRADGKLDEQINRMRTLDVPQVPGGSEYRLNPEVFYLKFVKRDRTVRDGAIITPLGHFEILRHAGDAAVVGPKGARRVSHAALSGRFLREGAFLDLIRSGYVGAYAATTAHLKALIDAVLENDEAVVAAIQRSIPGPPEVR